MDFQQMKMALDTYWATKGCLIWQPHNEHVGAGTANPATVLRVLGTEPWNVGYLEPSARPADGRYGENPNRWCEYMQYQVVLKPDPGNHIDLYLESLAFLGLDLSKHDIRFVEDNWQSPSLGAWGLGWEVWLDGMEITQYTYFQQACGIDLFPSSVEITYGMERIAMFLQGVKSIPEIRWQGDVTYGDLHLSDEVDYCRYNFDIADISTLQQMYELSEREAEQAIVNKLVLPAHDYVLRCSHLFNVLDARGAIGVTQRHHLFGRMRELAKQVAQVYLEQRDNLDRPFIGRKNLRVPIIHAERQHVVGKPILTRSADLLFEVGTEELPAADLTQAIEQLRALVSDRLSSARLAFRDVQVMGTPRRLVILVHDLAPRQSGMTQEVKGPPAVIGLDGGGNPTEAAMRFAENMGVVVEQLEVREQEGKHYLIALQRQDGEPAIKVLSGLLAEIIRDLRFPLSMHWNESHMLFSRPIRWIVALLGRTLIDVELAGVSSDRFTYSSRPDGSRKILLESADDYLIRMKEVGILLDTQERKRAITNAVQKLAKVHDATMIEDPDLLQEVANLVEEPVAVIGEFDTAFLSLPPEVLITVLRKHQRFIPLERRGELLPQFIGISNGRSKSKNIVRIGYEGVVGARFTDAKYFFEQDLSQALSEAVPRLEGLTFHEQLGSYKAKTERIVSLAQTIARELGLNERDQRDVVRTAQLAKADLVTHVVVELTSLQGIMGSYYASKSGEPERVARGIREHYQPRGIGSDVPSDWPGVVVGLADRADSLVGLFGVDMGTSRNDPYGLRRAALGIEQILVDKKVGLSLRQMINVASALQPIDITDDTKQLIWDYLYRRLEGLFIERGFSTDLIEAVLKEHADQPAIAASMLVELKAWSTRPEFAVAVSAYQRAARMVRAFDQILPLDKTLLVEPTEQALATAVEEARLTLRSEASLTKLVGVLASLSEAISEFFREILVMHDDHDLRQARLALLQEIVRLPVGVVSLTGIEISEMKGA